MIKSPIKVICHICALMKYWAGLFAEMDQEQLIEGADLLLKVAKDVLAAETARQVDLLLLQNGEEGGEDVSEV